MVVGCVAAATTTAIAGATADSSTWWWQSVGPLHRAAGLCKWQRPQRLWCWMMDMVEEVVSTAVAVTVAVLRTAGLL